jgi:tRNA A37 methylthiotransferase MiaB
MKRADVKIGFGCNNHCQFCVQGDKKENDQSY